ASHWPAAVTTEAARRAWRLAGRFRSHRIVAFPAAELAYLRVLNAVLLKPRWWEKLACPTTVAGWRRDAAAAEPAVFGLAATASQAPTAMSGGAADRGAVDAADGDATAVGPAPEPTPLPPHQSEDVEAFTLLLDELDHIARGLLVRLPPVSTAPAPPPPESPPTAVDSTRTVGPTATAAEAPLPPQPSPPPSPHRTITPTGIHGVYVSDDILEPALLARLRVLATPLEAAAAAEAGRDATVLNLVHPSPHALVYERTLVAADPAAVVGSESMPAPPAYFGGEQSRRFQWLPAEVNVGVDGSVAIRSYINNLDPARHGALYATLATVVKRVVPMLELALGSLRTQPFHRMATDTRAMWVQNRRDYALERFLEAHNLPEYTQLRWVSGLQSEFDAFESEMWEDPDFFDARPVMNWPTLSDYRRSKAPVASTVGAVGAAGGDGDSAVAAVEGGWGGRDGGHDDGGDLVVEGGWAGGEGELARLRREAHVDTAGVRYPLCGRRLKVIFKMACVRLTAEQPRFDHGQWHIEGMENEAIAATALVYYDVDEQGVSESRVAFRHGYDSEQWSYEQGDYAHLERLFGVNSEMDVELQECGAVNARNGRVVVFPNFLHHRVEPFELAPGARQPVRRCVLALFLVHPDAAAGVWSTAAVPPQQRAWLARRVSAAFGPRLPAVVADVVAAHLEGLGAAMDPAEARALAEELSEERRHAQEGSFADINHVSLCEH
ncbi:hypothetical protein HK405_010538, partial [Cladochytrium tenue]